MLLLKIHLKKDIFLYNVIGLVQPTDKIVARFALTIYPYSLDEAANAAEKTLTA
jgi:hypothetical protein